MTHFENVLVGVDGIEQRTGCDRARLAAGRSGAKLTLANVRAGEPGSVHALTPGLLEEERDASLRAARARAR